MGRVNLLVASR